MAMSDDTLYQVIAHVESEEPEDVVEVKVSLEEAFDLDLTPVLDAFTGLGVCIHQTHNRSDAQQAAQLASQLGAEVKILGKQTTTPPKSSRTVETRPPPRTGPARSDNATIMNMASGGSSRGWQAPAPSAAASPSPPSQLVSDENAVSNRPLPTPTEEEGSPVRRQEAPTPLDLEKLKLDDLCTLDSQPVLSKPAAASKSGGPARPERLAPSSRSEPMDRSGQGAPLSAKPPATGPRLAAELALRHSAAAAGPRQVPLPPQTESGPMVFEAPADDEGDEALELDHGALTPTSLAELNALHASAAERTPVPPGSMVDPSLFEAPSEEDMGPLELDRSTFQTASEDRRPVKDLGSSDAPGTVGSTGAPPHPTGEPGQEPTSSQADAPSPPGPEGASLAGTSKHPTATGRGAPRPAQARKTAPFVLFNGWFRQRRQLRIVVGFVAALLLSSIIPAFHAKSSYTSTIHPLLQELSTARAHAKLAVKHANYRQPAEVEAAISQLQWSHGGFTVILWTALCSLLTFLWFKFA